MCVIMVLDFLSVEISVTGIFVVGVSFCAKEEEIPAKKNKTGIFMNADKSYVLNTEKIQAELPTLSGVKTPPPD